MQAIVFLTRPNINSLFTEVRRPPILTSSNSRSEILHSIAGQADIFGIPEYLSYCHALLSASWLFPANGGIACPHKRLGIAELFRVANVQRKYEFGSPYVVDSLYAVRESLT